jgi:hypothetical protein
MEAVPKPKMELLFMLGVLLLCALAYIGRHNEWFGPILFGAGLSLILMLAVAGSLIWILIRTMEGKPASRRLVFLYVGIAVVLPLVMPLTQKIEVTPEVKSLYDGLQTLKPGSKVLASFDYDPPSAPELQPMAESFFRYCFDHELKVIIMGLWPQGPQQANMALAKVMSEDKYKDMPFKYGVDYVNLGFQSGNEFVIQRMGSDFKSMFQQDFTGTPYDSLPLVRNIKNFSNIDYAFNLSAGYPGTKEWVLVGVDQYGFKMGAGNTAVQTTSMYPYVRSGQLKGILGGMSGAAEFELVTKFPAKGTRFMLSQSFAHVVVVIFIVISNVAYIMHERKRPPKRVQV